MKRFFSTTIYLFVVIAMLAQQTMHLGKTPLLMPSEGMKIEQRSISMKTTAKGARAFNYIGGVAFIQTAAPVNGFLFDSISLGCDLLSQTCYLTIDNARYAILLDAWMLQPIVNYVNDTSNAIVTLYGKGDAQILYHPAFVDKLLGLRLFQSDLMFCMNCFEKYDMALLPTDENNNPIMAKSETKAYCSFNEYKQKEAIDFVLAGFVNYQKRSGKFANTYIYTDRDQKIEFAVKDGKFSLCGEPYYLFANTKSGKVDTASFIENMAGFKKELYNNYLSYMYLLATFNVPDSIVANVNKGNKYFEGLTNRELLTMYNNMVSNYSRLDLYENLLNFLKEEYPLQKILLLQYVKMNVLPYPEELTNLTNYIKSNSDSFKTINPIVYDAAIATCQWSAFFRYMKENNPNNWELFVRNVNQMQYDAPDTKTPINIENEVSSLFNLFGL